MLSKEKLVKQFKDYNDNTVIMTETKSFSWPNYIIYEGRKVHCSIKNPNFAQYMLPGAYMNKKITVTKNEWLRYVDKYGYYD